MLSAAPIVLTRPGRRNLGLNLFYTDECPASYEPRGFTSCVDDNLRFPGGPALARRSKKTPSLVVGSHRVGVVVSHVDSTEEEDLLRVIPEELDYPNKRSRLDEYKATSSETTVDQAELSSQPLPAPSQPPLPSDIVASPAAPSTQTRDDMQTKEALQRMQLSSSRPRDLIPTQSLVHADDLDNEDSNGPDQSYFNAILNTTQTADRRERMIVPAKMAELIVHIKAVQERCSPSDRIFDEGALNNYVIKRKATPNVIKCECIDDSEEGIMVCPYFRGYCDNIIANDTSFSVRFVAPGNISRVMAGTAWRKSYAQSTMSATAVSCCQKRRI